MPRAIEFVCQRASRINPNYLFILSEKYMPVVIIISK